MDNIKRVMISLPRNLLREIDGYVKENGTGNRSEFIREAMRLYLREKKRQRIREELREGYVQMSSINRELADEGIEYDARLMAFYEESLAESE